MASPPQSDFKPAKIITPAIRQRLQERLTQARKLSRAEPCPHKQIDELLCECVIVDPGNTAYIGALLHHLRRSDRPRRTEFIPFWRRFFGQERNEFHSTLSQAAAAKHWEEVLAVGPPLLCQQPQSVEILHHLAAACAALEHEQAELCYLQAAVAIAPRDVETQRQLARALTRQGRFDEALPAWDALAELIPADDECQQTLKILRPDPPTADATGWLTDDEERAIRSDLAAGTLSMEQLKKLLDHLRLWQWHRLGERHEVLDQAAIIMGPTLELQELRDWLIRDQTIDMIFVPAQLARLRQEYQQLSDRQWAESRRLILEMAVQRCERYPGDRSLRLELGRALNFNENFGEAAKTLGPLTRVPELRATALFELARSWRGLKQNNRAVDCLREAIDLYLVADNEAAAKDSLDFCLFYALDLNHAELVEKCCRRLLEFRENEGQGQGHQFYRDTLDNLGRLCQNP